MHNTVFKDIYMDIYKKYTVSLLPCRVHILHYNGIKYTSQ